MSTDWIRYPTARRCANPGLTPDQFCESRQAGRWRAGGREPYTVRGSECRDREVCVVTARLVAESADGSRVTSCSFEPNDAERTLALPVGRYVITIRDPARTTLSGTTVTVLAAQ